MRFHIQYSKTVLAADFICCATVVWAQPSAFAPEKPAVPAAAPAGPAVPETAPAESASDVDPIEAWMAKASLPDRVAQLMLVTIEGGVRPAGDNTGIFKSVIPGGVLVRRSTKPTFAAGCVTELRALSLIHI